MVMGMANLAMATGNIGRDGVGVNPLRGQNNVQGSCDMGSFPHELPGYRHVVRRRRPRRLRAALGHAPSQRAGPAHPEHVRLRDRRLVPGAVRAGRGHRPVRPEHRSTCTPRWPRSTCVVVQDLFENETAKFAHVLLPGTSFLEKDGTFTNAERRINRVRPVMAPRTGKHEWEIVCEIAQAMGYPMHYDSSSQIMDEIATHHADVRRGVLRAPRPGRQRAVAVQRRGPGRHADHARRTGSSAARAGSSRPSTCRRASAARGSTR